MEKKRLRSMNAFSACSCGSFPKNSSFVLFCIVFFQERAETIVSLLLFIYILLFL